MKKAILKVFGVAALAAGMMYNVQVFEEEGNSGISLAALGNMAVAQSEGGGGCYYTIVYEYTPYGLMSKCYIGGTLCCN